MFRTLQLSGRNLAVLFGSLLCVSFAGFVSSAQQAGSPTLQVASTCPSRTINYITETLPQQCLRSSWTNNATPRVDIQALSEGSATANRTDAPAGATSESNEVSVTGSPASEAPSQSSVPEKHENPPSSTSDDTKPSRSPDIGLEGDSDPLSDNANFLSFEEWKSQMLKKAGQSPEHIGGPRSGDRREEARRRPGELNNALDSLGDDAEIELDFTGFVNQDAADALPSKSLGGKPQEENRDGPGPDSEAKSRPGKEAGTTSKERFNYASFDCAATVLKTNPGSKGSTSILVENKDSYMLNKCSDKNKFVIVELCSDLLIDTIVLGNYEFFSSTFRTFRVSIADRYPVKMDKWRELGTFEARNARGIQAFVVENGIIWARYLRIEFLTHYGTEYYCPVSLLRIHGKTMMDDYLHDVKASRGEDGEDENDDEAVGGNNALDSKPPDLVIADTKTTKQANETSSSSSGSSTPSGVPVEASDRLQSPMANHTCPRTSYSSTLVEQTDLITSSCNATFSFCNLASTMPVIKAVANESHSTNTSTISQSSQPSPTNVVTFEAAHPTREVKEPQIVKSDSTILLGDGESSKEARAESRTPESPKTEVPQATTTPSGDPKGSGHHHQPKPTPDHTMNSPSKPSHQPPLATPATQESFFKSVHKRLQLLEANSSLSLQYIEEQSRILREAFTKVEKRQLSKTTTFLENLNVTVLSELREFRLQYDQIWQSTVLELSSQREQSQREVVALSTRLTVLANEILWQKRLVYLQFLVIVICLGLVMFSRSSSAAGSSPYLELPLLQNMVAKPSASFARYLNLDSPPGTPSRPGSRYGLFSRAATYVSSEIASRDEGTKNPNIEFQLPTPTSENGESAQSLRSSPEPEVEVRRVASTPALGKEHRGSEGLLDPPPGEESKPLDPGSGEHGLFRSPEGD